MPGKPSMSDEALQDSSRFRVRGTRKLLRQSARVKSAGNAGSSCEVFFTGMTSYGPVSVGASMKVASNAHVKKNDVLHALILGVIESKIQFVENWLQTELDIAPGYHQLGANSELFTIVDEVSATQITLHLPVQFWNLIPHLPDQLFQQEWIMNWAIYKGSVTLSRLSMKKEEVESISDGSLVLIPESFDDQWESSLEVPEFALSLTGHYDAKKSAWIGSGGIEVAPSESVVALTPGTRDKVPIHDVEIENQINGVITFPSTLKAEILVPSLGQPLLSSNKTSTHQICRLSLSDGKVHTGFVAPVSSGYGMYVTGTNTF